MFMGKRFLGVIPARGGSKGIQKKNIKLLAGKPLIAWTLEEAAKSQYLDRVIVSSEDPEIIEVAKSFGGDIPFVRPAELAQDDTPGVAPLLHAVDQLTGYDFVVLLQPTSPFRRVCDIDGCIKKGIETQASSCVSVTATKQSPYWCYTLSPAGQIKPLLDETLKLRRQDLPETFSLNGAVYVAAVETLKKEGRLITSETVAYVMPATRSLDIDDEADWVLAEALASILN